MTKKDIQTYYDPDDFEAGRAKYPCSSNRMTYDPLMHRYYLTIEAMQDIGIDIGSDYKSGTANNRTQFIEEVSDDLYGVILDLAPFNYQYMCYLIASGSSYHFPDKYTARKQFEKALLYQAQYKLENVDVRDVNGIDLETGNNIYHKQLRKEHRHISKKSLDILKGLGLFFNGDIPGRHMINYSEVM